MSEEIKVEEPKVDGRKGPKGVGRKEFEEFQQKVTGTLDSILDKMNAIANQPKIVADSSGVKVVQPKKDDAGPEALSMVPPAWRQLTDEILGTDFLIELRLPENGGQLFVVNVPKDKSNASKDHWDRYNKDTRTRELGNTGVKGVKEWLLKIRRNIISTGIKLPYYEDTTQAGIVVR